ncbi:putative secreted protein [Flavobacterium daejeonense]|nr:putative secreted protein [Flavobacterium daejeonense]
MEQKNKFSKVLLSLLFVMFLNSLSAQKQFKVLLITETSAWYHESIEAGVIAINELAATHNFEVNRQQKAIRISKTILKSYDAIIFLSTTGDIFDDREKIAIQEFIQSGKGFVGIHAAADTEYKWEWYTKLVGRMFLRHPRQQTAKLKILNHDFPGLESFPDTILWTDEWYEFGPETVSGLQYLMAVDAKTYERSAIMKDKDEKENSDSLPLKGTKNLYPISWYHQFDGGRAFYTALGHIDNIYKNHWFLDHLYGGIYYAATGRYQ